MPERKSGNSIRKILVGVDGSDKSIAALRWAAEFAFGQKAHLQVLTAWKSPFPTIELIAIGLNLDMDEINDRPAQVAKYRLDKALEAVYGASKPEDVDCSIEEGYAGLLLVERSRDADLLVVGNRGRGPMIETLMGSVSTYCASLAHCPVLIVKE
jgi:nucleotide-binding universal stress UspA family protein